MFSNFNESTAPVTIKKLNQEIKKSNDLYKIINERHSNSNKREHIGNGLIFSYAGHDT